MIESYPKIFNLGHREVATLLHGPVILEGKDAEHVGQVSDEGDDGLP